MEERSLLNGQLHALGLVLSAEVQSDLLRLRDELLLWNRKVNLTSIRDPLQAIEKHLVDSLTLYPLLRGNEHLLDLGSGGGFPGLPLKIVFPELRLLSVDAVQKKILFQRHIGRLFGFKTFTAWHGRAEDLPQGPGNKEGFDVVVSRAFASIEKFVALALPCLSPGGRIIAMKGPEGPTELQASAGDLDKLGVVCIEQRLLHLPATKAQRTLLVLTHR